MAYEFNNQKLPSDLELTLTVDDRDQLILKVHKNVLANASPYFSKLFSFGKESMSTKIKIHPPNIRVASDLIMSFYGEKINSNNFPLQNKVWLENYDVTSLFVPKWKYALEMIKCRIFFGMENGSDFLLDIQIPEEGFEELLNVIELIGFSEENIKIIIKNLPVNYDFSKLSKELISEMINLESNYYLITYVPTIGAIKLSDAKNSGINFLDAKNGSVVKKVITTYDSFHNAIFSFNDEWIASAGFTIIILCDAENGNIIKTFRGHSGWIICISFSSDDKWIISGGNDNVIKLWDVSRGKHIRNFNGHTTYITSVSFSPDNKWIISSCHGDGIIKLWDVESGEIIRNFNGHQSRVNTVSFSSDDKWIVSGGYDTSIKLWDVGSGQIIKTFNGHNKLVLAVLFSSDNKWIVSCDNYDIKLWEVDTGKLVKTFLGNGASTILSISLSSDDKYIVSHGSCIKLWDVDSGKEIWTTEKFTTLSISFSKKKHPNELAKKLQNYL